MDYIVESECSTAATTSISGKLVGCAGFELQSGCACDSHSSIEGEGDGDGGTYTVAAVSVGSGDSSNFGGGVEEDGGGVAAIVRHS